MNTDHSYNHLNDLLIKRKRKKKSQNRNCTQTHNEENKIHELEKIKSAFRMCVCVANGKRDNKKKKNDCELSTTFN